MSDYMPKCATCEHFESCIMQRHITEMALILWNISREKEKEKAINKPMMEWIPVSERLPKIGEVVLVTWEWGCKKYITIAYMVTIRGVTYWDSKLQHEFEPLNVLAWMPLPEPWRDNEQ